MNRLDRIRGCLLGGAVGDALGSPLQTLDWPTIVTRHGERGALDLPGDRVGAVSGDTQMLLFTAEGLLRAFVRGSSRGICHVPSVVHHALLRWLMTQGESPRGHVDSDGWLIEEQALWLRRGPSETSLVALRLANLGAVAQNDSKGCAALLRSAPCAFMDQPLRTAADCARLTHGNPCGYLAAGLYADILERLTQHSASLEHAITQSLAEHGNLPGMGPVREALEQVLLRFYQGSLPTPQRLAEVGEGWVAEQTLAMGLWCALCAEDFEQGLVDAINHGGNSNGTGIIAGQVLGLLHGPSEIPARWLASLELRDIIEQIAEDLELVPQRYQGLWAASDMFVHTRYPGS